MVRGEQLAWYTCSVCKQEIDHQPLFLILISAQSQPRPSAKLAQELVL
jgi:hypothetical protein